MILKVALALLSWSAVTLAKPQGGQLVQPEWNWQEVILSRNGPSTTTTPRPSTTWFTTTLRSFDTVEKIVGQGRGSVEPVTRNRGSKQQPLTSSGISSVGSINNVLVSIATTQLLLHLNLRWIGT